MSSGGNYFPLRTDHGVLKWLLNFKNPEGQLAFWKKKLQEFVFSIEPWAGKGHKNVDALLRRLCMEDCQHFTKAEGRMELIELTILDEQWQPENPMEGTKMTQILKSLFNWKETRMQVQA